MRRSRVTAAIVLASAVAVAIPLTSSAATVKPHRLASAGLDPDVKELQASSDAPEVDTNTHCGPQAADPVPDGAPIVVSISPGPTFTVGAIPNTWWASPPYGDSAWQLQMRGFIWLNALAQRASVDGQKESLNALVEQVVAFHRDNPDPNTNDAGWDEGSALRRLGAENCLYSVTQDARLIKGMEADVAVQHGWRYYGPPYKAGVHNHGVMADLAVVKAGDLLGRSDWSTSSLDRLKASAPLAWSAAGVTREQSSSYHVFNTTLWGWVADTFDAYGGPGDAGSVLVRGLLTKAKAVAAWVTEPDGRLTVFGDAVAEDGFRQPGLTTRTFRDDTSGVAVGRWSWTDPTTTYYALRYGPKRWGHGQQDRVGVTWSTQAVRVLVNPGRALYDSKNAYRTYAASPSSHNVAYPARGTLNTAAAAKLVSTTQKVAWHTWNFTDVQFGPAHARQLTILRDTHSLVCKDIFPTGRAFQQYWHLDPSWTYNGRSRSGKTLWFTSGSHKLTVATTGVGTVLRGSTRPVAGWNFPTPTTRVPAVELRVTATTTATTTFTVN